MEIKIFNMTPVVGESKWMFGSFLGNRVRADFDVDGVKYSVKNFSEIRRYIKSRLGLMAGGDVEYGSDVAVALGVTFGQTIDIKRLIFLGVNGARLTFISDSEIVLS